MTSSLFLLMMMCVGGLTKRCPMETPGGSGHKNVRCDLSFVNQAEEDLMVHWVHFDGTEREGLELYQDERQPHQTFEGHKFRIRNLGLELVKEYVVANCKGSLEVIVEPCETQPVKNAKAQQHPGDESSDAMFGPLVLPSECPPGLPSSGWSCVRSLSKAEVNARVQGAYGFSPEEASAGVGRFAYQVKDEGYSGHIPLVPHLTPQGFLIMQQPPHLQELLNDFYAKNRNTSSKVHEPIAGYYSNIHKVPMTKVDLDEFRDIRSGIVKTLQQVLEWWTRLRLRHTSTFGMRIYHEGSMLINHVDRHDTHLASAVIQVAQDVEEGWPLEIDDPHSKMHVEVYLQPGQMVLYEGARIFHGRPMRFKGKEFANVFSHFAPIGYKHGNGERFDWRKRSPADGLSVGWPRIPVGQVLNQDSATCSDEQRDEKKAPTQKNWWSSLWS